MPVFVEVTPDPFATSFRSMTVGDSNENGTLPGSARARSLGGFDHVRRPVRGIQLKQDTYATIQVRTADGRNIPLIDAGGSISDEDNPDFSFSNRYSNFLLQAITEQRAEKMQVVQTFGEPFVFFFGEHPRVISGSGVLLNTEDFNWRAEFWENYDKYLRGTRCVQSRTRVTLSWDDIVVEGYFIKADASESSTEPNKVILQFQMFLTNYQNVSRIGFSQFPVDSVQVNLDPNSIDTTGEGIGNLRSTTQTVRELNRGSFGVKNSLFQSLRDNVSKVLRLDGQLASLVELASSVQSGRQVRVPRGFAGGSVFDQETQIALASVDASSRLVLLQSKLGNQPFKVREFIGSKTVSSFYGKFQKNLDEYIARIPRRLGSPANPPDLFAHQKARDAEAEEKVREVFEAFGVDVDPPDEATRLAQKGAFGVVSVAIGAATHGSSTASSLRQITNAVF